MNELPTTPAAGYYRHPTLFRDTVVFVSEDDLWTVAASGGVARRLTANPGRATTPALSPDGSLLAFAGRDEGQSEVYVMPALGGEARRLTYLGADTLVAGWSVDGLAILFSSNAGQPFGGLRFLYRLGPEGGEPQRLPVGLASSVSYGPRGVVIGRNTTDIARWKRYRGGLTGELWVDPGGGDWRRLNVPGGNVASPLWVGGRIYFVSDHEGVGNLYSCTPEGADLRRHTHHGDYYVRHPATDGRRLVYQAGADLYLFDPANGSGERLDIIFPSPRAERKRRFVEAEGQLESYALHPRGRALAVTTRGRVFSLGLWEGPALSHGERDDARYGLAAWLYGGTCLVVVSDEGGESTLEVHTEGASVRPERLEGLDLGRPVSLVASPTAAEVALANHRNELVLVDLEARTARVVDRSLHARIQGMAYAPDGRWLAYGFADTAQTSVIKLCAVPTGETLAVTRAVRWDGEPSFDPEGKYLYFISSRDFNPVYDNLHFDLGFPKGSRPFLLTLRAGTPSPFAAGALEGANDAGPPQEAEPEGGEARVEPLRVDLEGIAQRLVAFPVPEGRYTRVRGLKGKVLFSSEPVEGALDRDWFSAAAPPAKGKLELYNFVERRCETLLEDLTSFEVSADASTLIYRAGNRLRVLKAGDKPPEDAGDEPGRKSGWLDLGRVRVSVLPQAEWRQMFREAWRLQRDHFWTADMAGIDWELVYRRYLPLLERVSTRAEFSDLMWEMQGELGTSHAYEFGGDYRAEPDYPLGFLGADLGFDPATESYPGSYVVTRVVRGDGWDEATASPLSRPGVGVEPGDRLLAVNGRPVSRETPPQALLVHQAESEVLLTVAPAGGGAPRTVRVKTIRDERPARYREWVEAKRRRVREATNGRVGYLHIPDMGPRGYAEFHRAYFTETARDGLIVDVRFNGGGHVSELLLEKLARKRLGYAVARWEEPTPYPNYSLLGPMVALTNEQAGSDGDIFSHAFKMMGLGPLVGKRTWGGVVGISARERLRDGGITTQPEYSFWFSDVGWRVENYGTEPTIEVEMTPGDYAAGRDPQLERALDEIGRLMAARAPERPDFAERPGRAPPSLPEP